MLEYNKSQNETKIQLHINTYGTLLLNTRSPSLFRSLCMREWDENKVDFFCKKQGGEGDGTFFRRVCVPVPCDDVSIAKRDLVACTSINAKAATQTSTSKCLGATPELKRYAFSREREIDLTVPTLRADPVCVWYV